MTLTERIKEKLDGYEHVLAELKIDRGDQSLGWSTLNWERMNLFKWRGRI